jgi:hypothetical protein
MLQLRSRSATVEGTMAATRHQFVRICLTEKLDRDRRRETKCGRFNLLNTTRIKGVSLL